METQLHQLARMEHELRQGPYAPRRTGDPWALRSKRNSQHSVAQRLRPALVALINLIIK